MRAKKRDVGWRQFIFILIRLHSLPLINDSSANIRYDYSLIHVHEGIFIADIGYIETDIFLSVFL